MAKKVTRNNRDPHVTAGVYIDCVKEQKGKRVSSYRIS